MANVIEIVIKATDQASAVIQRIGSAMGPAAAKTATGLLAANAALGKFKELTNTITAQPLVQMALSAGKAAFELGMLGAQTMRTEAAFARVVGSTQAAASMLDELKAATRGTRSEAELMENATNLIALGFGKSSGALADITRNVEALGARFGGTMQTFQLMMSNKTLMRIDSFGIGVQEATQRIDKFKASGMEAGDAFNAAILELMNEKFQMLGGTVDDAVSANMRLKATWEDLKAEVGKGLVPAVEKLVGVLDNAAKAANTISGFSRNVDTALQDNTQAALAGGQSWEEYARAQLQSQTAALRGEKMYNALAKAIPNTTKASLDLQLAHKNEAVLLEMMIQYGVGYGETLDRISYDAVINGSQIAAQRFNDVGASMQRNVQMGATLNTGIKESARAWDEYSAAMQQGAATIDYTKQAQYNFLGGVKATELATNAYREALSGTVQKEMTDYVNKQAELRDQLASTRDKIADLRSEQEKLNPKTQEYINRHQDKAIRI